MVYLIDDDESVRRALQRFLRSEDLEVISFPSVEEFSQSGVHDRRGCVVLDIGVPKVAGWDPRKGCGLKGVRMPIIAISAYENAEILERARALGATAFFRKPVDGQALVDAIHWAMGTARDHPDGSDG